jgi:hypothetical protein
MNDIRDGWKTQLASDIKRDGMGLELIDPSGSVVAEVFRCDSSKKVIVTTFNNDIPLDIFDYYYQEALIRLDPFEDGSSLVSEGINNE